MRPLYVTVHDSDSPLFTTEMGYYSFNTFELLAAQAAQQSPRDNPHFVSLSVHCTNDTDLEVQLVLERKKRVSFQCYIAQLLSMNPEEEIQEDFPAVYDAVRELQFVKH